jgi:hypothetical protein
MLIMQHDNKATVQGTKNFPLPIVLSVVYRRRLSQLSVMGTYSLLKHILGERLKMQNFDESCSEAGRIILKEHRFLGQNPPPPVRRGATSLTKGPLADWLANQKAVFGEQVSISAPERKSIGAQNVSAGKNPTLD